MSAISLPDINKLKNEPAFAKAAKEACHIDLTHASKRDLEAFDRFVKDFNSAWTQQRLRSKQIAFQDSPQIKFSSVDKKLSWLSNFFPTLIYEPDHSACYPSLEHAYVAYKVRRATEGAFDQMEIVDMTPKEVKQWGSDYESVHDQETLDEMRHLVELKFSQSSVIETMLKRTKGELQEFTSDDYWGTCLGTMTGPESNHLGKIIEAHRATL